MKKAFVYKDDKSDKFWWIEYSGNDFIVNYGKNGTTGKYEIKEFDTDEECERTALKLINSKVKKGYVEVLNFDFNNRYYFDDEEVGLHSKTSHPSFVQHFNEEFYYDCDDEEAPFGSDEGSDALYELSEFIKKHGRKDLLLFPQYLIEEIWDMTYMHPINIDKKSLQELLDNNSENEMLIYQSDQVIIAVALGQIKITGLIDKDLKDLAIFSLKRIKAVAEMAKFELTGITDRILIDLENFNKYS